MRKLNRGVATLAVVVLALGCTRENDRPMTPANGDASGESPGPASPSNLDGSPTNSTVGDGKSDSGPGNPGADSLETGSGPGTTGTASGTAGSNANGTSTVGEGSR
jgi:hypothetical protein